MKDFLKRPLAIGDSVIFITPRYREYSLGRVVKFTPKNVRLVYQTRHGSTQDIIQHPSQLIRVDGPELTMYLLQKGS